MLFPSPLGEWGCSGIGGWRWVFHLELCHGLQQWTTTPSMPPTPPHPGPSLARSAAVSRGFIPKAAGLPSLPVLSGTYRRLSVSPPAQDLAQHGLGPYCATASREMWVLETSLVPELGPQAAPWRGGTALEPSGPLGKMSLPIGMYRRAFSYDDALEDPTPMTPPPSDMGSIPWKPVIPERKYQHLAKVEEGEASASSPAVTPSPATDSVDKVPVVKAKATHVIMSSLITKQTQESIQRFEQQAGLRDAGYTPHKGLTTEDTKYLRMAEALHKLKLQSGEIIKEEKQPASAQSTPSSTPHSSPKQKARGWFTSGSSTALPGPNSSIMDSRSGDKDRNSSEKWSLFGQRSLQKSDSGGFATQVYRGAQKPSPMELIRVQATRMAEDPAVFKPPKMDVPAMEGKKPSARTHNLKHRDLNVLTPTGF
ncbi:putative monooxygenase p33MONOX isoform X1 [Dasypus novemcinctus]|uniref:putative monooxygenase p33MONOX isoform X1 n=1 Tax=Dasypus novemcinctus TaxID=9361 RepID=UPI00265EA778|nr:putative monooxygenase p33MONOX isoform X1 [Dasypus novemcinctus]